MSPGALSSSGLLFVPFPLSGLPLILVDCVLWCISEQFKEDKIDTAT